MLRRAIRGAKAPALVRPTAGFRTCSRVRYELKDLRGLPREEPALVNEPIINSADKFVDKAEERHAYGRYLMSMMPKFIQSFSVWKDELTLYVPPTGIIPLMYFLRDHASTQFTTVMDITGVDYPGRQFRFEVVYNLLSVRHNSRIRVKTYASESSPVPSVCEIFEGANWYERETYDMFGVLFVNHPDLRRIMTDYGFEGHPLRKDFPIHGYVELRYDEDKRRILYEPVQMTQAFRNFSAGSTAWEPVGPGRDDTPETFKFPTPQPDPEENKEEKK
ncbi:hypothetical protein CANCADRAFT_105673 [Tortispora caseinolytica NRRL Y-17796]|uniref:NADH:ubiquinone oxidoreductase 30kDa subunit domain-containing protein n=1 Tax=Tortispora caseinolytica NRRL Y-17796 TaxID=767744 RepID=A0A1E4TF63_9ASCO|nr:hypothetical protein CANCADRAFT_105673 [Tortispora caseinolytica NRRL Y-17796]